MIVAGSDLFARINICIKCIMQSTLKASLRPDKCWWAQDRLATYHLSQLKFYALCVESMWPVRNRDKNTNFEAVVLNIVTRVNWLELVYVRILSLIFEFSLSWTWQWIRTVMSLRKECRLSDQWLGTVWIHKKFLMLVVDSENSHLTRLFPIEIIWWWPSGYSDADPIDPRKYTLEYASMINLIWEPWNFPKNRELSWWITLRKSASTRSLAVGDRDLLQSDDTGIANIWSMASIK